MSILSDLFNLGKEEIQRQARIDLGQMGTSAHIAAQNQVVREFESQALTPHRNGLMTAAQAADVIARLNAGFTVYCQQLGYARALQGAADVNALAQRIIHDLQAESGMISTSGINLPPILTGGVGGTLSWQTIALVGVGLYLLTSKKGIF